jgi:hypothetical protein
MAPARRLPSLFARLLRYLADAVQPPASAAATEPLPAAASGNAHWLALVQERAPELLTGGGIHARVTSPDRPAAPRPRWQPPALMESHRSTVPIDLYATPPDGRRSRLRAPRFATVRALRRRIQPARRHSPKAAVQDRPQPASTEKASTGGGPTSSPGVSRPTASRPPPSPARFEAPRPKAGGEDRLAPRVPDRDPRREPATPPVTIWPATPTLAGAAPEFDPDEPLEHPALNQWPPLGSATKAPDAPPDFALLAAPSPELPAWPDERNEAGRWPELPDDEILWRPPASVFDTANLKRLDDEQRGW